MSETDLQHMHATDGQATLRDIFRSSPVVAWEHHVDDHLHTVNEHVQAGLVANFPKSPVQPRKQHILGQQWDAIRQRCHARSVCFRVKQQLDRDMKAWCSLLGRAGCQVTHMLPDEREGGLYWLGLENHHDHQET